GVFCRIKDRNMHAECFRCATCGTSLKNQGYFLVGGKLYCDMHARNASAMFKEPVSPSSNAPVVPVPAPISPVPAPPSPSCGSALPPSFRPAPPPVPPRPGPQRGSGCFDAAAPPDDQRQLVSNATQRAPIYRPPLGIRRGDPAFGRASGLNSGVYLGSTTYKPHAHGYAPAAPGGFGSSAVPKWPPQQRNQTQNFQQTTTTPTTAPTTTPTTTSSGLNVGAGNWPAPRRGRGMLNDPTGVSRIPICASCNVPIRGPFVAAIGKSWCPSHFICANATCRRDLMDCGFVEERNQLYCETCFERYMAPTCSKCQQRIKGVSVLPSSQVDVSTSRGTDGPLADGADWRKQLAELLHQCTDQIPRISLTTAACHSFV
ncbi:PDZ and LIM domain protein Zasp isoform X1, partial [Tropilaelaps mercedesae]